MFDVDDDESFITHEKKHLEKAVKRLKSEVNRSEEFILVTNIKIKHFENLIKDIENHEC
jgi:predicted  nucleic acid-binding Zn-ribbon protein